MRSNRQAKGIIQALRITVAGILAIGMFATSLATTSEAAARCGEPNASAPTAPVMACCQAGMAQCHMPIPTKACACKQPTSSEKAAAATLPHTTNLQLPIAIESANDAPSWENELGRQTSQCISWECDLPPPESHFGYQPNRAPPSL